MTTGTSSIGQSIADPATAVGFADSSLHPGGAITMSFADGVVHVMLDHSGDWTITAGVSVFSNRLSRLKQMLEKHGFFQAAEESGMVYLIWTSTLLGDSDGSNVVEETLLGILESFQSYESPSYIS